LRQVTYVEPGRIEAWDVDWALAPLKRIQRRHGFQEA
jgi:hypothetical protein